MCPICNKNLSMGLECCVTYDREDLLLFGSIQEVFYLIKFNHCGFFLKHHLTGLDLDGSIMLIISVLLWASVCFH